MSNHIRHALTFASKNDIPVELELADGTQLRAWDVVCNETGAGFETVRGHRAFPYASIVSVARFGGRPFRSPEKVSLGRLGRGGVRP